MKIAVLGAGAMGGLYGAYLAKNHEVYMVDINSNVVEIINQQGLTIYEKEEDREATFPVRAVTNTEKLGSADLIIVFVKNLYTVTAMEKNIGLVGENTLVLTLQNGAGNDRTLARFVKKENILIGTTEHNCANLAPGRIAHNTSGITNLGMMIFNRRILQQVADVFNSSGLPTELYENIQEIIWRKLFINMSLNSVTAILQCKVGFLHDNKDAAQIVRQILSEAVDVAVADGTQFDKEDVIQYIENRIKDDLYEVVTSMSQDVLHKRLTEIDHINGAVVSAAKEYGVETPYNECIIHLVHALEGTYKVRVF